MGKYLHKYVDCYLVSNIPSLSRFCRLEFDAIGKMETSAEDMTCIGAKAGLPTEPENKDKR